MREGSNEMKKTESDESARFLYLDEVDSTNSYAKRLAQSGEVTDELYIVAKKQSAGRGRMGRSFSSDEAGGLYMSRLFYPEIPASQAIRATLAMAVCAAEAIDELAGVRTEIKWVNDIYLNGKKLGGILTEGEFSEDGERFCYCVSGIGVNLSRRVFPDEIKDIAISLEDVSGRVVEPKALAEKIAEKLVAVDLSRPESFMGGYVERSFVIGRRVEVVRADRTYPAIALSIDDEGRLIVKDDDGVLHTLCDGEVRIKI